MTTMIQTKHLNKKYGSYLANNNVSLTLEKGDIYGLIGKNGAGKSTFFKLLMGLATPTSGEIEMLGKHSTHELNQARHKIGFMIGANFFASMSGKANLEYYRKLKGITDKAEVDRVLKLMGLEGVKKPFKAYSMGMKQRLGIANALMGNPDVVILDEPVNGLDPQGIAEFRKLIQRLNREYGITFIVSSHILGELGLMATRFGFIEKGVLIEEVSAQQLHERTRSSLKIRVSDTTKACVILEEELDIHDYKVVTMDTIIVNEKLDASHIISRELNEAGLDVYELFINETSLEDYFLNLVGGSENA